MQHLSTRAACHALLEVRLRKSWQNEILRVADRAARGVTPVSEPNVAALTIRDFSGSTPARPPRKHLSSGWAASPIMSSLRCWPCSARARVSYLAPLSPAGWPPG